VEAGLHPSWRRDFFSFSFSYLILLFFTIQLKFHTGDGYIYVTFVMDNDPLHYFK